LINSMSGDSGGVWVKALSETDSDKFYTGMAVIRLPLQSSRGGQLKIDSGFSLPVENAQNNPSGTVLKETEKNILKVYVLHNEQGAQDTLYNVSDPNLILHGQKRRVVYDSTYNTGDYVNFSLVTSDADRGKMYFADSTDYSLTLVDTSFFLRPWYLLAVTSVVRDGKGTIVQTIGQTGHNGKICMKDAYNGNLLLWSGTDTVAIAVDNNPQSWIRLNDDAFIDIQGVKNSPRLYKRRRYTSENEIVDYVSWSEFKDSVLNRDSLYFVCSKPGEAVIEMTVAGSDEINPARERLVVNNVALKLRDSLGRDLSLQKNAFSPKRVVAKRCLNDHDTVMIYDTARIQLYGLIFPEAQDTVVSIKIEIVYDTTDTNHVQFYTGTTGPNRVVRTLNVSNEARAEDITVKWDGRDSANNRILIEGKFLVKVTNSTSKNRTFTRQKKLYMAKPGMFLLGPYHSLSQEERDFVDTLKAWDKRQLIVWDSVPFLDKVLHRSFRWVFNPDQSMRLVSGVHGYATSGLKGGTGAISLINSLQTECSVFHITGHHNMIIEPGPRFVGNFLLADEKQSLLAECRTGSANFYCDSNVYCLNRKCNDSLRTGRFLDDVVLAVLIGCATDTGTVSTTQAFLNHGVDCVIGTKRIAIVEIMNFWNYYFWHFINYETSTINDAARDAYEQAITKYAEFAGFENEQAVYEYFSELRDFTTTIEIRGESNRALKPAHYGARQ
ncbi:MAG: hypothetical protein ACOC3T_04825, partial [Bacteroidota bacterium]